MTAAPGSDQAPEDAQQDLPRDGAGSSRVGRRSAARLGAVQALYQIEITGAAAELADGAQAKRCIEAWA